MKRTQRYSVPLIFALAVASISFSQPVTQPEAISERAKCPFDSSCEQRPTHVDSGPSAPGTDPATLAPVNGPVQPDGPYEPPAPGSLAGANQRLEAVPPDEEAYIQRGIAAIEQQVRRRFVPGRRPAMRDAHAKAHGCVKAQFSALNDDEIPVQDRLPEELRVGVLQRGSSFPAWIRFSNSDGEPRKDSEGDNRGMAIKLMNVPGEKLLKNDEQATQDFLLASSPSAFFKDVKSYVELQELNTKHNGDRGAISLRYFVLSILRGHIRWREFWNITGKSFQKMANPLDIQYWSVLPSQLGPNDAVKYSAVPCSGAKKTKPTGQEPPDHLRQAMRTSLTGQDACYYFMVQLQTDPDKMPIDDATIAWDETKSPFKKAAKIEIFAQDFDTQEQNDSCENLSFNPWHSVVEHKPLGGLNRARLATYAAISKLRHELNAAPPSEPAADSSWVSPRADQ